jgi:hypothetical protein
MDAPSGGGKLSLASVGLAGAGVASGGSAGGGAGYKELLVMALPKDDGLDGAKVAELIGAGLPDIGCSVRVRARHCHQSLLGCRWLLERRIVAILFCTAN